MKLVFATLLGKLPAATIAEENIKEYERKLLDHEASASYHDKMVEYYKDGITRLSSFNSRLANSDKQLT